MINEVYKNYKKEYLNYVLLIKSGNFYLSLNKDSYVMHNLFNYQLKEIKNGYKVGFPVQSINKIKNNLELLNINYTVIENNQIKYSKNYSNYSYLNYLSKKNYSIIYKRINRITEILKNNIDNDIESIITKIEEELCVIN